METEIVFPLLEKIETPTDLRKLPESKLVTVANELRQFLIKTIAKTGGHFSANLGTVELTVALHYVFNTPDDRIVWDVGHQTYAHKILTGRRVLMSVLRRKGGISGFPRRCESEYDTFGVGHSSTSLSAALGMSIAAQHYGIDRKIVAVIGDGAITAGMAFEALNHAGHLKYDLMVILNDNEMSISPNVGALSVHLTKLLANRFFSSIDGNTIVPKVLKKVARCAEEHIKSIIPGTFFEELGFNYFGPVDGHDLLNLVNTIRNLKLLNGPKLLHVVTRKGKGYKLAEDEPVGYHGVGQFNPEQGLLTQKHIHTTAHIKELTYTQVFGEWICDMAEIDERLIGITPAMREGSGLVEFSKRFPDRYFDVAIAEQHAVTLAAGLACDGLKPVVAIYSTFLQRAYDQLVHDVALQNLPVLFAVDRAGLVGPDGPTHSGNFDYSFLRCIPNIVIMAPSNENECRHMLYTGFQLNRPVVIRYPRGKGIGIVPERDMQILPTGKAEIRRWGKKVALLAFGSMVRVAELVADILHTTVVNMRFIKPLDEATIIMLASEHSLLVTLEENVVAGGAGSAVNECLASHNIVIPVRNIGLPDRFVEQGERYELLRDYGLDVNAILKYLSNWR